jgi:molybdate transport system substrate-binding protein
MSLLASACAGCAPAPPEAPIVVSVAASTQEVIESLAARFGESTGVAVKVNSGSSSSLAAQIIAGAPADVFLSANEQWAEELAENGLVEDQVKLLTNRLVIVVPDGNSGGVSEPRDLLKDSVKKIALAGENVPAGQYADQALAKLELASPLAASNKIARGQDVRSALAFVERGEAEAGIVYSTDVAAAKGVKVVHEIDPALHDKIVYVLVLVKRDGRHPRGRDLYEFLQSPTADAVLAKHGFSRASER